MHQESFNLILSGKWLECVQVGHFNFHTNPTFSAACKISCKMQIEQIADTLQFRRHEFDFSAMPLKSHLWWIIKLFKSQDYPNYIKTFHPLYQVTSLTSHTLFFASQFSMPMCSRKTRWKSHNNIKISQSLVSLDSGCFWPKKQSSLS